MTGYSFVRVVIATGAVAVLLVLGMCELGLAWPVAGWLYLSVLVGLGGAVIRRLPMRQQVSGVMVLAAAAGIAAVFYFVDWTSRKPFLRDLARVRIGMDEAEVRRVMAHYMEGTGWPALPGASSRVSGEAGVSTRDSAAEAESSLVGQLALRDPLVFRHSNDGRFNSDWGVVSFSGGKVVGVEFTPD